MTKWIAVPAALVATMALTLSVEAASQGNAKSSSPKTTKTSPKTTKTTTKAPSTTKTSSTPKGSSAKTSKKTASTTTAATSTTTTTSGTAWKPTNAVAEKLMTKPNQLAKLKAVLPANTDINDATAGFRNFGQLNAAVNVSQNLGIDFADLKAAMTGITLEGDKTNEPTKSLGQAIKQYRGDVDAEAEAAAATAQATQDGGQ